MANQPLNEKQLQALLRLKRHEQPPPGYFDDLLHSVHRRQREELLRRPAWRIMMERVGAFFAPLQRDWGYAGTMAAILMIGVGAIQIALPKKQVVTSAANPPQVSGSLVAAAPNSSDTYMRTVPYVPDAPQGFSREEFGRAANPNLREVKTLRSGPPRFIIDAQPASYEQTHIRF